MKRGFSTKEQQKATAHGCTRRPSPQIAIAQIHETCSGHPSHERRHHATEPLFANNVGRVNRQDVPLRRITIPARRQIDTGSVLGTNTGTPHVTRTRIIGSALDAWGADRIRRGRYLSMHHQRRIWSTNRGMYRSRSTSSRNGRSVDHVKKAVPLTPCLAPRVR